MVYLRTSSWQAWTQARLALAIGGNTRKYLNQLLCNPKKPELTPS